MAANLETKKIEPDEISLEFTAELQGLALDAWTAGLDGIRDREAILHLFNPNSRRMLQKARKQYRDFAKHGNLVVVTPTESFNPLGYAMSRNDVSPKELDPIELPLRTVKRVAATGHNLGVRGVPLLPRLPNRVYAWNKHLVAHPDAPKGVGSLALAGSLRDFHLDQKSTAYIYAVNEDAQGYYESIGYERDPDYEKKVYPFAENDTIVQWRFVNTVSDAIDNAENIVIQAGLRPQQ